MSMDRRILLDSLGWTADHSFEGAMRWTKALSGDLLSTASMAVKQEAGSVRFEVDKEECGADFEPATRPLLLLEFAALPNGRMALSKMVESGVEAEVGLGSMERAMGLAKATQAEFAGVRPKITLLRPMGPEVKIGAKL